MKRYNVIFAVVLAVLMLQTYFEGTRFTIVTGNGALQWILNMSYAILKLEIWCPKIAEL